MTAAWNFRDASSEEARRNIWEWICEERLGNVILSDLDRPATLEDWLKNTSYENGSVWSIERDGLSYAIFYVQDGINGVPMMHFSAWRAARKYWKELGFAAVNHVATLYGSRAVLALFPAKYRHIRNACVGVGFEIMGTIPGGCTLRGKPADATLAIWKV